MNYQETVQWMFAQLPMYQREGKSAFKPKLANTRALDARQQHPHKAYRCIHVGGTNGKGSTSHMIASVLQQAGYRVGLYTSPHLRDYRERIKVNGKEIPEEAVVQYVAQNREFFEQHQCSFFEMTLGLAFWYFREAAVDIAVVEVGLGGRWDATNIITPEVSVITNIGMDHTEFLGDTLAEIAGEKAGIIKPGVPVVVGEYQAETWPVFTAVAEEKGVEVLLAEESEVNYSSDLRGRYQKKNIKTAVTALRVLKGVTISDEDIASGLNRVVKNTGLLGRWQEISTSPRVICDTAHNREGLTEVMGQLNAEKFATLHMVIGVVKDKKLEEILPLFPKKNVKYYFCKPDVPRGLEAEELQDAACRFGLIGSVCGSVSEALESACRQATTADLVFVGGSTFTVAEIV